MLEKKEEIAAEVKQEEKVSTDVHYSPVKKFLFGLGLGGYNLSYSYWINNFFTIFCTDTLGIAPATLTTLTATVQSFDAIKDPIAGGLLDHARTRWGRYRPFVMLGAILTAFSMCMLFGGRADWSMNMKVGWVCFCYILAVLANTMHFQAYGSLQGCLTTDAQERGSISVWRMVGTGIGNISAGYIGVNLLILFSGGSTNYTTAGYFWAVAVCGALSIMANFATFMNSREVVSISKEKSKLPLGQSLKCVICNPPMLFIIAGMIVNGLMNYGRLAVQMYFFTYVCGDPKLAITVGVLGGFGTLSGGPIFKFIYSKTKSKGKAMSIIFLLMAVNEGLLYVCPVSLHWGIIALSSLAMSWSGALGTAMYAATGDVADYAQLKFGLRLDGLISSTSSFAMKVGRVIVTTMTTGMLAASGYVANAEQTQEVIQCIRFNVALFPAIISAAGAAAMLFYSLDDKRQAEIVGKLRERGDIA